MPLFFKNNREQSFIKRRLIYLLIVLLRPMKFIKTLLLKIFGEKKYLFFTAYAYQQLYKTGKVGTLYQDVYFLKNIIKAGDYNVDIGAHLGYYTFELSKLTGKNGKVIAIEPVAKFNTVIKKLIANNKLTNIDLHKVAIGGKGEFVEIGIPFISNQKRFGHARIKEMNNHLDYAETEKVTNIKGDEFFKDIPHLDFIKCDIEGAEVAAFTSMLTIIEKNKPIILCELGDKEERIKMYKMLLPLQYYPYILKNKKLHPLDISCEENAISFNYYFIPEGKIKSMQHLIDNQN